MNLKSLKIVSFLTILVFAISCSSEDNNFNNETDIKLVTGIIIKDENANYAQLGNPNIFTNNQLTAYPNPTTGVLTLKSNETISDIWFIPGNANKSFQKTNFLSILNSELYSQSKISSNAALEFTNLSSRELIINLKDLSYGYYKVFVKINGKIYWDNIYFHDNKTDINQIFSFWN